MLTHVALRGVRLLAALAAATLALSLLPAVGGHAQEAGDGGDDVGGDLPLDELEDGEGDAPPAPGQEDDGGDVPTAPAQEDGEDEPRVTEFEGERGTIVERSGDGLLPTFRYRGVGRHDTARLVATDNQTFHAEDPEVFRGADSVLVARADDFPDSLAGAALAGAATAPVLLVDTSGDIQSDTQTALDTIEPSRVFVLGGTDAISEQVESDLDELAYVDDVERIAGATRYETAAEVARRADEEQPVPELADDRVALLATGEEFADALAGGQVAYAGPFPLLLTPSDQLSSAAEDAVSDLEVDRVLLLGGTAAISSEVETTLDGLGVEVERLAGRDRTVTAVQIAQFAIEELDFGEGHVSVARGNQFADALAIAPHAGEERTPLLISATESALGQREVATFLATRGCTVEDLHVSGGFAAVSPDLEQQVRQAATGDACDVEVVTEPQAVDAGEPIDVEADVLTSVGESATAGVSVAFRTEAQAGGADDVACEPESAETDDQGRASCTLETDEAGVYEVSATIATSEGEQVSDSVLIGVGVAVQPPEDGDTLSFPLASERAVGEGFADSPNPLGPAGGDAQSLGDAELSVDPEAGEVCVSFNAVGAEGDFAEFEAEFGLTALGVYEADDPDAPGDLAPFATNNRDGEPLVGFAETPETTAAGTVVYPESCESVGAEVAQALLADPGQFYLSANTDLWPGGNLRGQLDGEWDDEDRSDEEPRDA